jgi:Fic family protein
MSERHSLAEEPPLIQDEQLRAEREAENAVRQFDAVLELIDEVERDGRKFRLRVSTIQELHRFALEGLSRYAGNWRPDKVSIHLSTHEPPGRALVPGLVEEMCDWINNNWDSKSGIDLCSYVMWRLNWIHPFDDGNGRTTRAVAYLVLCAKARARLPGRLTIPEIIAQNKTPYYDALEKIDESAKTDEPDLTPMIELLTECLAKQLAEAWEAATSSGPEDEKERKFH